MIASELRSTQYKATRPSDWAKSAPAEPARRNRTTFPARFAALRRRARGFDFGLGFGLELELEGDLGAGAGEGRGGRPTSARARRSA